MAAEEPFDTERPPDEAWWTRELHRNEKLMDKYMAVLGDNPDWEKWHTAERAQGADELDPALELLDTDEESAFLPEPVPAEPDPEEPAEVDAEGTLETDPDEDPEVNAGYPTISQLAREFACNVFNLDDPPCNAELLFLSAGKVGANLAGGHGLGYDDEFICGNIVKCRWALSDCEFCREMLEHLYKRTGDVAYAKLAEDSRRIADAISERITVLRRRVWW